MEKSTVFSWETRGEKQKHDKPTVHQSCWSLHVVFVWSHSSSALWASWTRRVEAEAVDCDSWLWQTVWNSLYCSELSWTGLWIVCLLFLDIFGIFWLMSLHSQNSATNTVTHWHHRQNCGNTSCDRSALTVSVWTACIRHWPSWTGLMFFLVSHIMLVGQRVSEARGLTVFEGAEPWRAAVGEFDDVRDDPERRLRQDISRVAGVQVGQRAGQVTQRHRRANTVRRSLSVTTNPAKVSHITRFSTHTQERGTR